MEFGAVIFVACQGFSNIVIQRLDKNGYNRFCLRQLYKHVYTTHCLTVQSDSCINNAEAWDDAWMQYDYIGAPWPVRHGGQSYRVGNSGFCLRSRRLLKATANTVKDDHAVWHGKRLDICADDVITCIQYRKQLEAQGLKFAPVDVAAKFAFEQPTPEATRLDGQFGFHTLH